MLALEVQRPGYFCACIPAKAASSLAGNETVLFIFLRLEIKEFIGLILKLQSHLKTKAEQILGLFSPERTKYRDKVCSAKNDITFGQRLLNWVQGFFLFFFESLTSLDFFPPVAVCGCVYIACREFINTGKTADQTKFQALFLTKTSSRCHQVS